MVIILERWWPRSDFSRDSELGQVAGTIASDSLYFMDMDIFFLEGVIVRNIYWLGCIFI